MPKHRIAGWVVVACALIALALLPSSCAQVAGLGDLERVDCLDNCDGGGDGTALNEGGITSEGGGDGHVDAGCPTCTGATPVCDTSTNTCVACVANPDCAAGTVCINKMCTPGCAADHASCGADGGDCDVDAGVCRQCIKDADCGGANPRCDVETFQCVPCLTTNDNCALGTRCVKQSVGSYMCALGCRTIADCFVDAGVGPGDGGDAGGGGAIACCNNTCINTSINGFNCGMCGNACGGDGGAATTCCNSTCHDKQSDPDNCGGCGIACSNNHMGTRTCGAGTCNGTCAVGFSDCNGNKQTDGCEIGSATDPNNCGGCGTVCSNNNMATRTCAAGACNGTCVGGTANCNNTKQMNGCNVSTSSDPNNCGGCGTVCSGNNVPVRTCASGACNGTCAAGTTNCDNTKQLNGCNVDTANDPNNCGGCGIVCSANNMGTRTCAGGVCNGTCVAGFSDCDGNKQTNGCEIATATDPNNCGGCGAVCSNSNMATRTCGGGSCNGSCSAGFSDCDANKRTNGCEVATGTDPNNCGGCGTVCSANNMATRTCGGGACNGTCVGGTNNCDGTKQANGCNVNTTNDPNNCGACGTSCSNNNMATRTCGGSVCNGTCSGGFGDCNSNLQTDGCELATTTALNCTGCGLACNTTTNSARNCTGTTCTYTCNAGRADCNSATAPDLDGCECAHPTCGGNGCASSSTCPSMTHLNGAGQSFYDCTASGTFNNAQAHEACTAYAISQGHDSTFCVDFGACPPNGGPTVCYSVSNTCTNFCWGYTAGKNAGWLENCSCPDAQIGSWN